MAVRSLVYTIIVAGILAITTDLPTRDDAARYLTTTRSPGTLDVLPFRLRFLSPLIEWALPLSPHDAAVIVTCASLIGAALVLARLAETYGISTWTASTLGGLFLLAPPAVGSLRNPLLVDPLSWLLIAAAILAMVAGRPARAGMLIVLGALNRETSFLLIPDLWRRNRRVAVIVTTGAVVFLAVLVTGLSLQADHGLVGHFATGLGDTFRHHLHASMAFDVVTTFGLCWVLAAVGLRYTTVPLKAVSVFTLLIVAQMLVATDEARLLFYLFPVVLPLAGFVFDQFTTGPRIVLVAALLATFANNRWDDLLPRPARYVTVAAGFAVGGALLWWRLARPSEAYASRPCGE